MAFSFPLLNLRAESQNKISIEKKGNNVSYCSGLDGILNPFTTLKFGFTSVTEWEVREKKGIGLLGEFRCNCDLRL